MLIAIYVRVSTDQQAEKGYSLATQLEECHKKATELENVVRIDEYVDDGYSGAYLERPALEKLRNLLKEKPYFAVIIYDPDRLARNLTHQLILTDEIESSGARLIFINFEWNDSPEGKLFYSIRGAVSAYEREKIKERTQRGMRGKATAGKIVRNNRPYGYDWDSINSMYVVNEEEAKMIRNIFSWVIDEHLGIRAIATRLAKMNYPTKTEKNSWNIGTVHDIIQREMYAGIHWANKEYKTKIGQNKVQRGLRKETEWIPVKVPSIISREVWEAAQYQLHKNKNITKRPILFPFICRNLVICSLCGTTMRSIVSGKNRKPYYVCKTGRAMSGKSSLVDSFKCPARQVPADVLDKYVWSYISNYLKDPTLLADELSSIDNDKDYLSDLNERIKRLETKGNSLVKEREKITLLFKQDLIDLNFTQDQLKEIKASFEVTEEQKSLLQKEIKEYSIPSMNKLILTKVNELSIYANVDDVNVQRQILISVISRIEVNRTDSTKGPNSDPEIYVKITFRY